jgi:hypothetical protein
MTTPPSTKAPLDYYPPIVRDLHAAVLDVQGTPGARALAAGVEALEPIYGTYVKIAEANEQMLAQAQSRRRGPGKKVTTRGGPRFSYGYEGELWKTAAPAVDKAIQAADRRLEELGTYRAAQEKKVAEALSFPGGKGPEALMVASKILDHVKGLPKSQRTTFLYDAVEADDVRTISAVLGAPGYLSGVDEKALAAVRTRAAERWAPIPFGQVQAMGKIAARIEAAKTSLKRRLEEIAAVARATEGKPGSKAMKELGDAAK